MKEFDVCVIGSGAGGAPVAYTAAQAGRSVVVLEKGPWYREQDFFKDEIAECRRNMFTPKLHDEPQVVEEREDNGWSATPTYNSGWNFWNGSMVGGASNIMSGFFQRMKPIDFRLLSEFGPIEGADVQDWPISYDELEPFYAEVERIVGVSGKAVKHKYAEPRSTADFPMPPTFEHPIAKWLDKTGHAIGLQPTPLARAILSQPKDGRGSCSYTGFCGDYGCATGAKGSARAALIDQAVKTGRCEVRPHSMVKKIVTDRSGNAIAAEYIDEHGNERRVNARAFAVACQPVETARLLLLSHGEKHPNGLGNNNGMVGQFLIFSASASVEGALPYRKFSAAQVVELEQPAPFINRSFQDWYVIDDKKFGPRAKGGTLEFMFVHPNPISVASWYAFSSQEKMLWGSPLKDELTKYFREARHVMVEIFLDWMPTANTNVTLDPAIKDKWGLPVARVRIDKHDQNHKVAKYLARRAKEVMQKLGAEDLVVSSSGDPATNLVAGGCRFGNDPKTSALDKNCRIHGVDNVFVTDGSCMPTGGSVPYTWTIYANSFRVAREITAQLA